MSTSNTQERAYARITSALMAWYAEHARDLPWRRSSDPYEIWVSEIMLQQTQVATVIPYYERFLARFPTVEALAAAELDEVLALWQGLGYYARGRHLHAAAQRVVAEYGGALPRTRKELLALPGIGDYTAGAILSIVYGQDEPAVDANVARILTRLLDYDRDPTTSAAKRVFYETTAALLPAGRARDFLQALMDLGATVCVSRGPRCGECPLAEECLARARGVQEERPVRKSRAVRPHRSMALAACQREGRLLVVRRVPRGLLGGLWELPGCEADASNGWAVSLRDCLDEQLDLSLTTAAPVGAVDHGYSHFDLTAHLYRCTVEGEPAAAGPWDDAHWLSAEELADYGLTGLTTKALAALAWPQEAPNEA